MVLPRLVVLIVDVAVEMGLRSESLFALVTLVRSFVISFVMAMRVLVDKTMRNCAAGRWDNVVGTR